MGGGGGGHAGGWGGGGHPASGSFGGGSHSLLQVIRFQPLAFPAAVPVRTLSVDYSPSYPDDLPSARIHRFLEDHLPHPHWVHWFHG